MYYQRIAPILGDTLENKVVGIINSKTAKNLIDYLASCGVKNFKLIKSNEKEVASTKKTLSFHNNLESYQVSLFQKNDQLDVVTGIIESSIDYDFECESVFGGFYDEGGFFITSNQDEKNFEGTLNYFNYFDLSNQLSKYVIAKLLKGTPFEQAEVSGFLEQHKTLYFGNKDWCWYPSVQKKPTVLEEIVKTEKTVLVIGCGSLGSVFAKNLAPLVSKIVLADAKKVSIFNPVRQAYRTNQIGCKKVKALAKNLDKGVKVVSLAKNYTFENIEEFKLLLAEHKPDLVVLATATTDEYYLAEVLWNRKIPHLSIRCYPRAKWFEVIFVKPDETPCFACVRGSIYTGFSPTLTPEQEARYDPNFDPSVLDSEPATKIDSARCADVATRVAYEFLREKPSKWFSTLIKAQKNCLIGSNRVEKVNDDFCYGLSLVGQVVAYGLDDLKNTEKECLFCLREQS